jgi:phosphotransferase system enzyme I (PtsP)
VLVADAPEHPRFHYFPEAGEEPYVSFFGVPILSNGVLRGVLVVQTAEPRDLTTDWAAVATAAQRIAPFVIPP